MKSKLLLTAFMILGYVTLLAQDLVNCKNPCKKTRIVKSGPYMGLRTLTLPDSQSVRVVEVVKNGPSVRNGILLYDTLTHFNGNVIKSMDYFIGEVAKLQPDDTITVRAVRSGVATVYRYPLGALYSKKVSEIVCCDEPETKPITKPDPDAIAKNEPKAKRKAKRELEPIQPVGPDIEPELETEPLTENEPKAKRKAKRELEPIQPVGPDIEPELETDALTENEPKPKRKAKREIEPIQPVGPDVETQFEPEPLRTAQPILNPKPKPEPIPASEAQQLAELKQNNLAFILSPTPAKAYLFINCYEEIKTEVTLHIQDLNGNVVLSEKVSKMKGNFEAKMDISTLADGVYFVKIYVENTEYVQRFVKEN